MTRAQITLDALLAVKEEFKTGKKSMFGICRNYKDKSESQGFSLQSYFKTWEHFSGDLEYPVPEGIIPYENCTDMFSKTTRYGRLRHNLLNHCIREAKKDVADDL